MANKKTIMFYINAIHDGGAERVIILLAKLFADHGHNSILVTSFIDDDEYKVPDNVYRVSLEDDEIKQSRLKRNVSRICKLRKLCKVFKPDYLISFMAEANIRAIVSTRGLVTKCIVSVRNDPNIEYRGVIGHIVGKVILPIADGCVFQTAEAMEWFPERLKRKSVIIENPVDSKFFETDYVGIDSRSIVTLGRLVQQKNQKMLLKAFSIVCNSIPEYSLHIYGQGPLKEELDAYVKQLNLDSKVELHGLIESPEEALSKAEIFALSSDYEGLSNALLEAQCIGVPSIATDCPCGGSREIIMDKETGNLVRMNDPNEMAEKMLELINDRDMRVKYSENAIKHRNRFSSEEVFNKWNNFVMSK